MIKRMNLMFFPVVNTKTTFKAKQHTHLTLKRNYTLPQQSNPNFRFCFCVSFIKQNAERNDAKAC